MRFSTKSGLAILALYFAVLGGIALWMDHELRSVSNETMRDTAQLIGREIAAALTESTLQQVLTSDPQATSNLKSIVADVTERSQLVTSLLVVDANGTILAADNDQVGQQAALPQVIFGTETQPRFVSEGGLTDSNLYLFVPLLQHEHVEGYLRLALRSARLSHLYTRGRRQLLIAGGAGLVAIVLISMLLHLQLNRLGNALTGALQAAIRGERVRIGRGDGEFTQAFEVAERVGRELSEAREKGSQALRRLGSLMQVMDVGVMLVNGNGDIEFLSERARDLVTGAAPENWDARWLALRTQLAAPLAARGHNGRNRVDVDLDTTQLRVEIYRLAEGEDREGSLLLIRSRESIEALENELRLAIQMRGFARFYMAMAHDLKAPLNAMVMNLELLRRTLPQGDEVAPEVREKSRRYIDVLSSEIARLDRQLKTLLQQTLVPRTAIERFDLRELIDDLSTLLAPQARHQRVTLDAQLPTGSVTFSGQRDRLKQALLNIAINALEAMPSGGQMTMSLEQQNGEARIWFIDSGPGIPPELLKNIYQMHFTTKDGGTGIGLYVARSVVEAHGGQIDVETDPGRGTRFGVTLPLSEPA
jgi:signal transduction histidine kinase